MSNIASININDIYRELEQDIVSLRILPGEELSENSLCERFSVSRTPIRSVLQRLEEKKFVSIVPRRPTTVTAINLDLVMQLIYERVAVETMVFRDFLTTATPKDVEQVRYRLQNMQALASVGPESPEFDIAAFFTQDHQMHKVWFHATNKAHLWERITSPHPDYSRFMRLDMAGGKNVADVLDDHKVMMSLIDSRSTQGIEDVMHAHLYGGIHRLGSFLFSEEYKGYFQQEA